MSVPTRSAATLATTTDTATAAAPEEAVLVLQGGGALGAYQAGAYEAMADHADRLHWVAGISIGAINAALIAGNPPARRVERLRAFWSSVSLALPLHAGAYLRGPLRHRWDDAIAVWGAFAGVPGFFRPRPPWDWWPHSPTSLYDTTPLLQTLHELVDFDLLNDGPLRVSVGAVDVESGHLCYFDNREQPIGPEHIMASGALPPGFAAVPIDGRWYWDGGLVSNTPLMHVMNHLSGELEHVTVLQVDLFSAAGGLPHCLPDVTERAKDIRYSSRTQIVTEIVKARHQAHMRAHALADLLTPRQRAAAHAAGLLETPRDPAVTLVHVIHRGKGNDTSTKDFEFSQLSMDEHWAAGSRDMSASLRLLERQPPCPSTAFRVFDYQDDALPAASAAVAFPAEQSARAACSGLPSP